MADWNRKLEGAIVGGHRAGLRYVYVREYNKQMQLPPSTAKDDSGDKHKQQTACGGVAAGASSSPKCPADAPRPIRPNAG
jgi:hypothetical protein